jgi:hypothetical protein
MHYTLTVMIFVSALVVALSITELGDVFNVVGGTAGTLHRRTHHRAYLRSFYDTIGKAWATPPTPLFYRAITDARPKFTDARPKFTDARPKFTDARPKFTDARPKFTDARPKFTISL